MLFWFLKFKRHYLCFAQTDEEISHWETVAGTSPTGCSVTDGCGNALLGLSPLDAMLGNLFVKNENDLQESEESQERQQQQQQQQGEIQHVPPMCIDDELAEMADALMLLHESA
jgi:hypothetical protein